MSKDHPRGWSQVELAERAGVTQSTVSQLENGSLNATVEVLNKIANALDVEVSDLFEREGDSAVIGEIIERVNRLSDHHRSQVLDYIEFLEVQKSRKGS